jgi:cobalt transporter subunit CbtB
MNSTQQSAAIPQHAEASERACSVRTAIACAALGVALVWLAGFSQMEALHNGAHDARHGAALPCH